MEPCTVLADTLGVAPGRVSETVQVKVGEGAAIVVPTVEEAKTIGAKIAADVDVTKFTADDDRVDVVVHDDVTDSTHQIVFVCNPTEPADQDAYHGRPAACLRSRTVGDKI